ncbi:hypothetical protein BDL97_10G095100 [Sphagnum fallax]|nr:hypothetical protein BDL97_10G095100 [Sphagnum fallax]
MLFSCFSMRLSSSRSRSVVVFSSSLLSRLVSTVGRGRDLRFQRSVRTRSKMAAMVTADIELPSGGRVLSIQSHTVHGYVGNKAAVFPLQLLGFDVDPINSVQFSNHTGYATVKGQVLDGEQLWTLIEGLEANDLHHYTHLVTGYIGSVSFLEMVLRVVEKLRYANPDLIYVCDPVMGDDGEFYVTPDLVPVYCDKVVAAASMLTPNKFEAEHLTHRCIETEADALEACCDLHDTGPSKVVITSLDIDDKIMIIGSHVQSKGTGDLMTALLLGWSYKYPDNLEKAAELAVSSVQAVLIQTLKIDEKAGLSQDGGVKALELCLIQSHDEIRYPKVTFFAESL